MQEPCISSRIIAACDNSSRFSPTEPERERQAIGLSPIANAGQSAPFGACDTNPSSKKLNTHMADETLLIVRTRRQGLHRPESDKVGGLQHGVDDIETFLSEA